VTVEALQGPDAAAWAASTRGPSERSRVVPDDNHPQWNESFEFGVRSKVQTRHPPPLSY
jgi:hypothetical protein